MNIKRAKEEIKNTVRLYLEKDEDGRYVIPVIRQRPIFLVGAPGIGKTAIMEQIARECGVALVAYTITHHTRQSALGLPFIKEREYGGKQYSITEYTMSEIIASVYERMETTGQKEGILFLDEINCVSETLAPTMLQFLQTKTFGNTRLPEGWVVATAGNPPEYNRSVREFDVATLDRVKYMQVEADYGVWKEYAYQKQIHGSILSYLENKKENFYRMETTIDGKRFVTARGWEDLSALLYGYERAGLTVDGETVLAYLQDRTVAMDFANYLELYRKYEQQYRVEDVLSGGDTEGIRMRLMQAAFDERISMTALLLSGLNETFAAWQAQEDYTEELFGWLKEYRRWLDQGSGSGVECMEQIVSSVEQHLEQERAGGLLDRAAEKRAEKVLALLREYGNRLKLAGEQTVPADGSGGSAFELVRGWFEEELTERERITVWTSDRLAHAFGFMELCFHQDREELEAGPEMIYFVTELESNGAALAFIRENGSEEFYHYSSSLFLDQKREGLLAEMRGLQE